MRLAAVILAAGYSTRMVDFKPLLALGGMSLLARCAQTFRRAGVQEILVVSGHRHPEVAAEAARLGLVCTYNPHYDRGMFSSVCTALPHLAAVDGFFLLPVDIPLVRPATIKAIAAAFDGRTTLVPVFAGQPGHPPLIPGSLIPEILAATGEGGLKAFLATRPGRTVPVWDRGVLLDADTPEDFAGLTRRMARLGVGEPAEALALARLAMPEKGVAHGQAVALAASLLGRELNRHGHQLDMELLHNAALLHDIAKGQPQHEARGAELLAALGLEELAPIVAAHRDVPPPASGRLSAKEVVCLADKLVRGTTRLSVHRRFAEKLALYQGDEAACRAIRSRCANALALAALVEKAVGRGLDDILAGEASP